MPQEIRSRYQQKTLEERTYNLEECTCNKCGHWFMVDYAYLESKEIDCDPDFVKIICPYCGHIHYEHV